LGWASINYTTRLNITERVKTPGKQEPAFVGLADLQNAPHKWHGFRFFAYNLENCLLFIIN